MKNLSIAFAVCLLGCQGQEADVIPLPVITAPADDWIIYEGVIPSPEGKDLQIELYLMPGAVGVDSYYRLHQWAPDENEYSMEHLRMGRFTTLYGSSDKEVIVHVHAPKGKSFGISKKHDGKLIVKPRPRDLIFKSAGLNGLVLLDDNMNPVREDSHYNLVQRSRLFTVEGYVTFSNDTADFFEFNTRENWVVAKLGTYGNAKEKYGQLAREKYEGIYLKALAYSVVHTAKNGEDVQALVFKKILEMHEGGTKTGQ
jgi:hypothetical protein